MRARWGGAGAERGRPHRALGGAELRCGDQTTLRHALAGGVEMGWDGMGRDGARWGAVAGVRGGAWREGRGGMGEGWVRDG